MADYYPVLKRAISSLPSSSGEARRAVYEKARAALLKQLQSYDPPLSPAEVTDQRLALEECIRRVESETAGAAFGLTAEPAPQEAPPSAPPPPEPPRPRPAAPAETVASDLPQRVTVKVPPPAVSQPLPAEEKKPAEPGGDAKIEAGMSAFSRTLRQAETLGGASAQAVRVARGAMDGGAVAEPAPPAEKIEPELGGPTSRRPEIEIPVQPRAEPAAVPPFELTERPATPRVPPARPAPRTGRAPAIAAAVVLLAAVGVGGYYGWRALGPGAPQPEVAVPAAVETTPDPSPVPSVEPAPSVPPAEQAAVDPAAGEEADLEPKIADRLPQEGVEAEPVAPDAVTVQTEPVAPSVVDPAIPPPPSPAETPVVADAEPTVPAGDGAAPAAVDPPAAPPAEVAVPPATTPTETVPAPAGAPAAGASGPQVVVAQRAILYEEPIPGSDGSRTDGRVLWSFVTEPVLPGEAPTPQIRAQIEIPDRQIRVLMSIRKNADAALPASHIVELKFELPESFAGRSIDTTPGLIMKPTEDARGDPLIGAVAKVSDNLFWLALSGLDQDATRNVGLLKEGEWIDIPIRYTNRRRAILTFEKGGGGDQVFRQAFEAWAQ